MSTDSIRTTSISAFPVSHEKSVFVLTGSQLRQLISAAVAEAVAPLEARLEALESCQNATPEPQKPPENPVQVVEALGGRIQQLQAELERSHDHALREIAHDRQRISKLERPAGDPGESPLVDRLADHMQAVGLVQTSFSGAAKILGVTPGRISQIKECILRDPRFEIRRARSHKQKLLIKIVDARPFKTV